MSFNAYQSTARRAESPRELEYRLFGQVTRSLIDVANDESDIQERAKALAWNRSVWSTMATDCASEDNKLPEPLRAGIISLAMFVRRHSREVMVEGAEIDPLIEINRMIMEGLSSRPPEQAQPG